MPISWGLCGAPVAAIGTDQDDEYRPRWLHKRLCPVCAPLLDIDGSPPLRPTG